MRAGSAPRMNCRAFSMPGTARTTQFQAIPQATEERSPLNPGGVIDLDRAFLGRDAHVTDRHALGGGPLQLVAGIAYDDLEEARNGYLNYVGSDLGAPGLKRRQEANHVYDFDQYAQAQWDPDVLWRLTAGVRNNLVEVSSHDQLPDALDPDTDVRYTAVSPGGGSAVSREPAISIFTPPYGKGFETPTLNDLAYRSTDGSLPGLNIGAQAGTQRQLRGRQSRRAGEDASRTRRFLHRTETSSRCGRISTAAPSSKTSAKRRAAGAELALDAALARRIHARAWPIPTSEPSWH